MEPATLARMMWVVARHSARAPSTIARLASGSGATYDRLRGGADITSRRAARILRWLSDHWPPDEEWPRDISRPDHTDTDHAAPDTESSGAGASAASPRAGSRALDAALPGANGSAGLVRVPDDGEVREALAGSQGGLVRWAARHGLGVNQVLAVISQWGGHTIEPDVACRDEMVPGIVRALRFLVDHPGIEPSSARIRELLRPGGAP